MERERKREVGIAKVLYEDLRRERVRLLGLDKVCMLWYLGKLLYRSLTLVLQKCRGHKMLLVRGPSVSL